MGARISGVRPLKAYLVNLALFHKTVQKRARIKIEFHIFLFFQHDKLIQVVPWRFEQKMSHNYFAIARQSCQKWQNWAKLVTKLSFIRFEALLIKV